MRRFFKSVKKVFSNIGSNVFIFFSSSQFLGLCILAILSSAHAIEVNQNQFSRIENNNTNNRSRKKSKTEIYKQCKTNFFTPTNKPKNLNYGTRDKDITPLSCAKNKKSKECSKDEAIIQKFHLNKNSNNDRQLDSHRNAARLVMGKWMENFRNELSQLIKTLKLSSSQLKTIDDLIKTIMQLKRSQLLTNGIQQDGFGNCAESSLAVQFNLINDAIENDLTFNIQNIEASRKIDISKSREHHFTLLESNFPEGKHLGTEKVASILENTVNDVHVCDPWNEHLSILKSGATNSLYNAAAGWDTLEVTSIPYTAIYALATLPKTVQDFFNRYFDEMGLNIKRFCSELKEQETFQAEKRNVM